MRLKSAARITVTGLTILSASTALARPVPMYNWTGLYIGGSVGGEWQYVNYGAPTIDGSVSTSGIYGGLIVGYNRQFSSMWVGGIEANVGWLDARNTQIVTGVDITTKSTWESTLRLRGGYLIEPRTMVYLATGVAFTNQTISIPGLSDSGTRTGWAIGGGIERAIGGSWSFRAEYQYVDYGSRVFIGDLPVRLNSSSVKASFVTNLNKWDGR